MLLFRRRKRRYLKHCSGFDSAFFIAAILFDGKSPVCHKQFAQWFASQGSLPRYKRSLEISVRRFRALRACVVDFLQITNDMIDRSRHKEDFHIERIYRTMNFQNKEGLSKEDLITFLGVCGKRYRKEDIESLINRIDPWFVIIEFLVSVDMCANYSPISCIHTRLHAFIKIACPGTNAGKAKTPASPKKISFSMSNSTPRSYRPLLENDQNPAGNLRITNGFVATMLTTARSVCACTNAYCEAFTSQ